MRTGTFLTTSAVFVLTAFSASAQDTNYTDDRFKPRVYGNTGVVYSQNNGINMGSTQNELGVIRAQHIRQGDVSPEEYNRLLQEAERVKAYKQRFAQRPTVQVSQEHMPEPAYQVTQQPYEIDLFESTPVTTAQQSYVDYNTQASAPISGQFHTVVKNDTLYNLSKRFNVEIDQIRTANNISGNNISLGQQIIIPVASSQYSQNVNVTSSYSVDGSNPTSGLYGSRINRVVRPVTTDVMTNTNSIYAVLPKDTLYSISRQTCIGVNDLISVNGITDVNNLKPGQRLNVPAGNCLPR